MKTIILIGVTMMMGVSSYAQQEYSFTQYFEANSFYNPAATGTDGTQNILLQFRKQWTGFEGSPITAGALYENDLNAYHMGLGGFVYVDQIGQTTVTNVVANYRYSVKFNEELSMSFGLDAGTDIYSTDYDRLTYWETDQVFDNVRPTVAVPRAGTGVQLYSDNFYVGLSVPRLLTFNTSSSMSITASNLPSVVSNYYLSAGYEFPVGKDVEMTTNLLGKYTHRIKPQVDINAMATYREVIGLGIGYKSLAFVSFYMQYTYDKAVIIGYSFDLTTSKISNYSNGSHEILIKYQIPNKVR